MTKQTSWRNHRVLVFKGSRDTNKHDILERDYETRTLGEIFGMEPGSDAKTESLAMIPSAYARFDGRAHSVQREKGQFVALTADIDKGNHSYWDIEGAALSLFGRTIDCRIYSSSSATSEDKRWRIIAPLAEPMKFDDWNLWQRTFYAHLEEKLGTPVDWSLARAAQPVYLPNVPPAGRHHDGKPIYYVTQVLLGEPITPDNAVALPAVERIRQADAAEAQKAELGRQEALERLKNRQSDPGYRGSPIEAYNAAHDIEDLLLANGYVEGKRNHWRSPYQTGKTFATKVFGDYWVSLSESDVGAGVAVSAVEAWRGALAYTLQLYFDFSGYSDMAIGIARAFGLSLPINFHSPLKCRSTLDFWRRWHITLTRMTTTYVFSPISMMATRFAARHHLRGLRGTLVMVTPACLVTFVLIGFWHGASATFLLFGLLHTFYAIGDYTWRQLKPTRWLTRIPKGTQTFCARAIAFTLVVISLVLFRAPDVPVFLRYAGYMAGGTTFGTLADIDHAVFNVLLLAGAFVISQFAPNTQQIFARYRPGIHSYAEHARDRVLPLRRLTARMALGLGFAFVIALAYIAHGRAEFLYFGF